MTHPLSTRLLLASHLLLVSFMACGNPSETKHPIAPYGTWTSPLTAAQVTAGAVRLDQIQLDGDHAPRTAVFEWRDLPPDMYQVTGILIGPTSFRATVIQTARVLPR